MLEDKTVLVTGGTGSFGKAFIKRILKPRHYPVGRIKLAGVKKVIVFSRDELKQWEMQQEIQDDRLRYFLGDVRDRDRLARAFSGVDIVVHAAALKQVPAAEYNPFEFVKTNVYGSQNVIDAAIDCRVEKVIGLSTDKACAPVTSYGTSKAMMEHLFRAGQSYSQGTVFSCLRYGNVAGSRGSVIPLWKKAVECGHRILPVTHPNMTRFFFTLDEAVDLCMFAMDNAVGGELYIPQMQSFKITDLAAAFGCTTTISGIRGVEKVSEAMISQDEAGYFRRVGTHFVRSLNSTTNLPVGFQYTSDRNDKWLSVEDLELLIQKL